MDGIASCEKIPHPMEEDVVVSGNCQLCFGQRDGITSCENIPHSTKENVVCQTLFWMEG
jgi:hypothetical protein